MAHNASQSAGVHTDSEGCETCQNLEESESAKEGTRGGVKRAVTCASDDVNYSTGSKPPKRLAGGEFRVAIPGGDQLYSSAHLEDTSCGRHKNMEVKKESAETQRGERGASDIKVVASAAQALSVETVELVNGCASLNLANNMERVNSDSTYRGHAGSPFLSSEEEWEASNASSETDGDHSDSSDDDNPRSQVDDWLDSEAYYFMDGENSNLSESDDSDTDSDITDVSPILSACTSPLWGLSPAVSRRNLPSDLAQQQRQPFVRHYSHKGHDGDDEDDDEDDTNNAWPNRLFLDNRQSSTDLFIPNMRRHNQNSNLHHEDNMSYVMQALLKLRLERTNSSDNITHGTNQNERVSNKNEIPLNKILRRSHSHMSPALQANPHHRHLRKHSHPRRKNMSFTNEEVRIINRDNSIMLDKLLAVHNRSDLSRHQSSNSSRRHANHKPASASINRRKQEQGIQRENLALLRRLQEVKPTKGISSRSSRDRQYHSSSSSRSTPAHVHRPTHSRGSTKDRFQHQSAKDPTL